MYIIRDRLAGNEIERASTLKEAIDILTIFEQEDKENDIYEEDFYEIVVE